MWPWPWKCSSFVMDLPGNDGCVPLFNHWSGFRSWLIGLSLESQKESLRPSRTRRRLASITERALACTAEQQLTFARGSCQCFLQTRMAQRRIAQLALGVKAAWWDLFRWHSVGLYLFCFKVACFLLDVLWADFPAASIRPSVAFKPFWKCSFNGLILGKWQN